jgi:hypothetical protein
LHQRNDDLWLDRSIFESGNDGVLEFDLGTTSRANGACIWNRNVTFGVDSLIGYGNEIARPDTGFGRNEKAAWLSFKNRNADNISDSKPDFFRRTTISERRREPGGSGR